MKVLDSQRALFGIPADVAYFNCASLAPLLLAARVAGRHALDMRGHAWRITAPDWFDHSPGAHNRRRHSLPLG